MAGGVTNVWPLPASAGLKHWAALQERGGGVVESTLIMIFSWNLSAYGRFVTGSGEEWLGMEKKCLHEFQRSPD